jgi:3-deoxy-manno-octulosonate cytidylyltransferase (CMP-KDO synthetase)
MKNKIAIFIPVRLASTRLPNKPLADICGMSMIQRVYNQAVAANLGAVFIACDGEEIALEVAKFGAKYVITDPNLPSGTDRIYAALKQLDKKIADNFEVIINLQGDLPIIDPAIISRIGLSCLKNQHQIVTAASIIQDTAEINNPNAVKIALAPYKNSDKPLIDGKINSALALYFSRSPIPYGEGDYYHHIGIYAYSKEALEKFVSFEASMLEKREKLEQLRALENDMKIAVEIVDSYPHSVDTKEDLAKVISLIKLDLKN